MFPVGWKRATHRPTKQASDIIILTITFDVFIFSRLKDVFFPPESRNRLLLLKQKLKRKLIKH